MTTEGREAGMRVLSVDSSYKDQVVAVDEPKEREKSPFEHWESWVDGTCQVETLDGPWYSITLESKMKQGLEVSGTVPLCQKSEQWKIMWVL